MLAFGILLKCLADLDVNRLTTPLEFFAAATRAGTIWIESHKSLARWFPRASIDASPFTIPNQVGS